MITTIVLCGSGSVPVTDDGVGAGPVGAAVVDRAKALPACNVKAKSVRVRTRL